MNQFIVGSKMLFDICKENNYDSIVRIEDKPTHRKYFVINGLIVRWYTLLKY